jgi:uncharacterized protein
LKLHLARFAGRNAFTGYGHGHVLINGQRRSRSVIVLPDELRDWPATDGASLDETCFADLMKLSLDILLLGTGRKIHFPHPSIIAAFRRKGIGLEVMDTPAACRTYNILLSEERKVGAAIVIEPESDS